jgi:tetratricopeptide (TPR) repeat protein
LDPENPAPCLVIAELKAAQGFYTEVDTWIKAALERADNDIDIWKTAVRIYLSRNLVYSDFPLEIAEKAVSIDPNDAETHLLLGWAYVLKGDIPKAQPEIDLAIELNPSLGQAYYLRGLLQKLDGKTQASDASFTRAADLGYFP